MNMEKIKNFFKTRTAKSIVVASAALLIGLAVYLNYRWFYDPVGSLGFGDNNMDDNYSDSSSAAGDATENRDYFTATALDRKEARDEALDVLKMVTESDDATEAAKAEAQAKMCAPSCATYRPRPGHGHDDRYETYKSMGGLA
jgi:hypothetical protein